MGKALLFTCACLVITTPYTLRDALFRTITQIEYTSRMNPANLPAPRSGFGTAWLLLGLAFSLHIVDETTNHFLPYYNATVLHLYGHVPGFPRIDLELRTWLGALVLGNLAFLALTPWAFGNAGRLRVAGYLVSVLAALESAGQLLLTARGHTTGSVQFAGVSPGFYTAPLLLVSSVYLIWSLRRSAPSR